LNESEYYYGKGNSRDICSDDDLEYHSLQTYIDLMEKDDVFEIPTEEGAAQ